MENPDVNTATSAVKKAGMPWGVILIGGAVLVASSLMSNKVKLPGLTQDDIDLLNTSAEDLTPQIQNDTSPVIFGVSAQVMTPAERAAALAAIDAHFAERMEVIAKRMQVDKDILTDAIVAVMALQEGEVRQQALDLFLTMYDAWTKLVCTIILNVGAGVAGITAGTANAITNAKTCAHWTLVKRTEHTVDQTSTKVNSVRYTSSGTKVLMGLLGSGNTQTSFHQTITTNTMHESLTTEFVPFCDTEVTDPDAVFAIMTAHVTSLQAMYDMAQVGFDLAPRIEKFVKTTP